MDIIRFSLVSSLVIAAAAISLESLASGARDTADYENCKGRVKGIWAFGRAPDGCNAKVWGKESTVYNTYGALVFDENKSEVSETSRYMENLFPVLRDAADYYISLRRKKLSDEEKLAWRKAIFAMAHQESYWSHYKLTPNDGNLKLMRGDYGHGYGITQVDDRWHYSMITNSRAWDLLGNITYGMEMYFQAWEKATKASCVREGNFEDRARSAYGIFNGGPGAKCRWKNSGSDWARNDKGFLQKYRNEEWNSFETARTKEAPIQVPCLMEKADNCKTSSVDLASSSNRETAPEKTAANLEKIVKPAPDDDDDEG